MTKTKISLKFLFVVIASLAIALSLVACNNGDSPGKSSSKNNPKTVGTFKEIATDDGWVKSDFHCGNGFLDALMGLVYKPSKYNPAIEKIEMERPEKSTNHWDHALAYCMLFDDKINIQECLGKMARGESVKFPEDFGTDSICSYCPATVVDVNEDYTLAYVRDTSSDGGWYYYAEGNIFYAFGYVSDFKSEFDKLIEDLGLPTVEW